VDLDKVAEQLAVLAQEVLVVAVLVVRYLLLELEILEQVDQER
jgi:hypothetical protein